MHIIIFPTCLEINPPSTILLCSFKYIPSQFSSEIVYTGMRGDVKTELVKSKIENHLCSFYLLFNKVDTPRTGRIMELTVGVAKDVEVFHTNISEGLYGKI